MDRGGARAGLCRGGVRRHADPRANAADRLSGNDGDGSPLAAVIGGTWRAAGLALAAGFAANTAGGSHHALVDGGAGYCNFNDLAVAVARLLEERRVGRIAVVDLDVHQGDGTATIFAGDPRVATLSLHAAKNFPVRKATSTRDVGLPDGIGDDAYLAVLADELPRFLDDARPDLVLYQAGVDPHVDDRLGRLALSDDGLIARDRFVAATCLARALPLASTPGGGYGVDRAAVAGRHARTILTLAACYRKTLAPLTARE